MPVPWTFQPATRSRRDLEEGGAAVVAAEEAEEDAADLLEAAVAFVSAVSTSSRLAGRGASGRRDAGSTQETAPRSACSSGVSETAQRPAAAARDRGGERSAAFGRGCRGSTAGIAGVARAAAGAPPGGSAGGCHGPGRDRRRQSAGRRRLRRTRACRPGRPRLAWANGGSGGRAGGRSGRRQGSGLGRGRGRCGAGSIRGAGANGLSSDGAARPRFGRSGAGFVPEEAGAVQPVEQHAVARRALLAVVACSRASRMRSSLGRRRP